MKAKSFIKSFVNNLLILFVIILLCVLIFLGWFALLKFIVAPLTLDPLWLAGISFLYVIIVLAILLTILVEELKRFRK